jgi:hypothetical protein
MKEVGFKEYHDDLGVSKYLVLKCCVKHFSFTSLNSLITYVALSTQNKVLANVILKFIAL